MKKRETVKRASVKPSNTQFDVVTIGSATVDVHAVTDHVPKKISSKVHLSNLIAFPSGSKILIDELLYSIGGGGTNTATAFAILGAKTGYVGCVGTDLAGKDVLQFLKQKKIAFFGHTAKAKTGYSIILDAGNADRTILTYKGANNFLSNKKCKSFHTKWLYLSSMLGSSYQSQLHIAKQLHTQGTKIAFNPSEYQAKQGVESLWELLQITHTLILNKQEIELLTNTTLYKAIAQLHQLGIQIIVVSDGSRPVVASDGTQLYSATPRQVTVVEATGAGDAFASTFVWAYQKYADVALSIKLGLSNSTSVITHHGAKEKLLTEKELIQYKKRQEVVVHVHKKRTKLVA